MCNSSCLNRLYSKKKKKLWIKTFTRKIDRILLWFSYIHMGYRERNDKL